MNGAGGGAVEVIVKALYNYTAEEDDELSFVEGDEIVQLSEPDVSGNFKIDENHVTFPISRMGRRQLSANRCNRSLSNELR